MSKYMNPEYDYFLDPGPLQSETTHKADYIQHKVKKADSFKKFFYCPPDEKMEMATSYRSTFVEKPIERTKPIKGPSGKQCVVKFTGESRYKNDFKHWEIKRTEPIHQYTQWEGPEGPFGETSVYVTDFKRHPHQSPRSGLKRDHTVPKSQIPLDLHTSHNLDYIKHPIPDKYKIPKDIYIPNDIPFEKLSIHKLDYTPKKGQVRESFKPDRIRLEYR